jgi:tetratricopeptide (TPR) repeat protein
MGFLVLIGPALEDALGRYRFLALYLGGGIAAELLHVLIALYAAGAKDVAFQPLVGASGAIAASAGLYAFRCYASRIRVFWLPASVFSREGGVWEIPALLAILLWMGLNVAGAVACLFDASRSEVAYWAHIGGFLFGVSIAVCGNLLGEGKKERLLEEVRADLAMGGEARIYGTLEKLRNALIQSPGDAETKRMLVGIASRYGARSKGRAMVAKEYGLLIDSYFEKGMPDLAMRWIEEAHVIDLSPALSATSLFALARFLTRRGSFDSAAQVYARLLAEQPLSANAPIAYLELADLQLNRLNRPADASATLHEYCSKQVRVSAAS